MALIIIIVVILGALFLQLYNQNSANIESLYPSNNNQQVTNEMSTDLAQEETPAYIFFYPKNYKKLPEATSVSYYESPSNSDTKSGYIQLLSTSNSRFSPSERFCNNLASAMAYRLTSGKIESAKAINKSNSYGCEYIISYTDSVKGDMKIHSVNLISKDVSNTIRYLALAEYSSNLPVDETQALESAVNLFQLK